MVLTLFGFFQKRTDRRQEERKPLVTPGECADLTRKAFDGIPFKTYLIDLSFSGCQIISNAPLNPTSLVSLRFKPPADAPAYRLAFVTYSQNIGALYRNGLSFVPQGRETPQAA